MSKRRSITIALDAEMQAGLTKLADRLGETPEGLVTTALLRLLDEELYAAASQDGDHEEFPEYRAEEATARALDRAEQAYAEALRAFAKVGEDEIARGEFLTHEGVMEQLKSRFGGKNAA